MAYKMNLLGNIYGRWRVVADLGSVHGFHEWLVGCGVCGHTFRMKTKNLRRKVTVPLNCKECMDE